MMKVDQKTHLGNAREEQQMSNEETKENGAEAKRKLTEEDCEFLLANVDNPHSDYDEEAEGWVNYTIKDDHLVVSHQDEAGDVTEGRWHLTFVGGSARGKGQDDD